MIGLELLPLVLLVAAGVFIVRRSGANAAQLRTLTIVGVIVSLGGCVGSIGALGEETSGSRGIFSIVSPYAWVGAFLGGLVMVGVGSFAGLTARREQALDEDPDRGPDGGP